MPSPHALRPSRVLPFLCGFIVAPLAAAEPGSAAEPIPNVGPAGELVKLHDGLKFTEGPAWDGKDHLYFTDIPADRIYRTDGKTLEVVVEPSGHCNGLMFDAAGTLHACGSDGALLAFDASGKERAVLAGRYGGERFNAPNDLVHDRTGGVYFTDPRYNAPEPWPQKIEAVYYRAADGRVSRVIEDLSGKAPNGVILSPDERTLYVVCSVQPEVMAYAVTAPGTLGPGRIAAVLKLPEGVSAGGGDGLTVDTAGRLYITSSLGVQVFDGETLLGIIAVPETPANATFGGPDLKTLYITARTGLYACPMTATGHAFPGGGK